MLVSISSLITRPRDFIVPNYICDRFITEAEATTFLHGEPDVLDGFVNKNTKLTFSAYLTRGKDGKVELSSKIGFCPQCGGRMLVGIKAFNYVQTTRKMVASLKCENTTMGIRRHYVMSKTY